MNGERFLEAINRLPFQQSIEALRSFAHSSKSDAHEQALLQMLIVLNLNQRTFATPSRDETATTEFTDAVLKSFYKSVLPGCSFFQKLLAQLCYPKFLSVYLTWVYSQYRNVRVETLLRYGDRDRLVETAGSDHIPSVLNETEEELATVYKSSITEDKLLRSCYSIVHARWKHRFYTRNLWICLMWLSLASVAVLSVMLSNRGSPFQFLDAILGWFEFFREYFK